MATHTLSLLSVSSIASSSQLRRFNDFRLILPSSDKTSGLVSSVVGRPLSIRLLSPNRIALKPQSTVMTVVFSQPTSEREDVPADKLPKWSARAAKSIALAELQVLKLQYPEIGTEALLLGILVEGTSEVAKFLRANGITHEKVREETLNLLGKSPMYFLPPFRPPLTKPAQKAMDWAVDLKLKSGGDGEVTVAYLLLGLWEQKESASHLILESLGFNDEKAKEISKYLDKDVVLTHKSFTLQKPEIHSGHADVRRAF